MLPARIAPSAAPRTPSHSSRNGSITVGSTRRSTKARGVNCAPSRLRSFASSAFSSKVPKMAGSTSAQSLLAASSSQAISARFTGNGSAPPCAPGRNRPPLKRNTACSSAMLNPPASIVAHKSPTSGRKATGLARHRSSSLVKPACGSSPTLCANMQKMQRIRKVATCSGAWRGRLGSPSSAAASLASNAAMSRVTWARRRAGSSDLGSSQTWRSNSRTSGLRRSGK